MQLNVVKKIKKDQKQSKSCQKWPRVAKSCQKQPSEKSLKIKEKWMGVDKFKQVQTILGNLGKFRQVQTSLDNLRQFQAI